MYKLNTIYILYIRNNVDLKIKYVRKGQQLSNRLHTVSGRGAYKKRVAGDGLDCTIERCPVILLFLLLRGAVNNSRTGSLQRSRSGSSSGSSILTIQYNSIVTRFPYNQLGFH